jgi:hypothetical protein
VFISDCKALSGSKYPYSILGVSAGAGGYRRIGDFQLETFNFLGGSGFQHKTWMKIDLEK